MKYRRMDYIDRINLEHALKQGHSQQWIARRLRFHPSTICREIKRNKVTPRSTYTGGQAERFTWQRWSWRRQPRKLKGDIKDWVIARLKEKWSPEQICLRMRLELGFYLTAETVYRMIERDRKRKYSLGLWRHLRQANIGRQRRCSIWNRTGKRRNLPSLAERSIKAEKRSEKGHWERNTMLGTKGPCGLLVMVDRKTRYTRLGFLQVRTTKETCKKTIELMAGYVCKSITSDRGPEFVDYENLQEKMGVPIFFCASFTPSERGTNENTIGLVRQYFKKGKDISLLASEEIQKVEDALNRRPRKCLDWRTSEEVFFRKTLALCT